MSETSTVGATHIGYQGHDIAMPIPGLEELPIRERLIIALQGDIPKTVTRLSNEINSDEQHVRVLIRKLKAQQCINTHENPNRRCAPLYTLIREPLN